MMRNLSRLSFVRYGRIHEYRTNGIAANIMRIHQQQAFHRSVLRYSPTNKSKIEETLEMIRDDLKLEEKERDLSEKRQIAKIDEVKPSVSKRIINEIKHYYHGFRLLALEMRLSAKYLWRLTRGQSLMRRERKQLIRTLSDLFRLVPFSVFIIVPFMEFALPLYVKLFPNALPSTFQDTSGDEKKIRRRLKLKLEMAKFLQDTIAEIGLVRKSQSGDQSASKAYEFAEFMKKVRTEGGYVSNAELFKYTKLFQDELTLDNLSMSSLRALCRMLDVQALGSPEILRFLLNLKLRELKADDKEIALEGGVDALSVADLQQACRARGMRALGMSETRLKTQLKQWLELSLNDEVPPSLLLLSRAIYVPEDITFTDRLKALLSSLPDGIAEQTRQKLAELEGDQVSYKARLDLIQEIENAIQKDRETMERAEVQEVQDIALKEQLIIGDPSELSEPEKVSGEEVLHDAKVASHDLESIEHAIHGSMVLEAKHDISEIKEKISDRREDLMELDLLVKDLTESRGAMLLHSRINRLLKNVDSLVQKLEEKRRFIAAGPTETSGTSVSADEQASTEAALMRRKSFALRVDDVLNSLLSLKSMNPERKQIFEKVVRDFDEDGRVNSNIVFRMVDLLNKYKDIQLNTTQIKDIVEMLKKEEQLNALEDFIKGAAPYPPSLDSSEPSESTVSTTEVPVKTKENECTTLTDASSDSKCSLPLGAFPLSEQERRNRENSQQPL